MWSNLWINAVSHWYVTVKDDNVFLCHLKLLKSKQHDCSIYSIHEAMSSLMLQNPIDVQGFLKPLVNFLAYCRLCIIIIDCVVVFWLFVASLVVYSTFKYHFRYIDSPTKRPARDGVELVELVPMATHFVFDVSQLIWSYGPVKN